MIMYNTLYMATALHICGLYFLNVFCVIVTFDSAATFWYEGQSQKSKKN